MCESSKKWTCDVFAFLYIVFKLGNLNKIHVWGKYRICLTIPGKSLLYTIKPPESRSDFRLFKGFTQWLMHLPTYSTYAHYPVPTSYILYSDSCIWARNASLMFTRIWSFDFSPGETKSSLQQQKWFS